MQPWSDGGGTHAANRIVAFLEHPYRYVRSDPANSKSDGIGRRNVGFDMYFGVKGGGGGGWLAEGNPTGDPEYVDQSNIIHAPLSVAGVNADSYFFAPFGYEANAMVALLHAPGASDGFAIFNFHMGGAPGNTEPDSNGESITASGTDAIVETGPGGGAMVYVAINGKTHIDCAGPYGKVKAGQDLGDQATCNGNDQVVAFQNKLGADGWWAVAMQYVDNPADAGAAAQSLRDWAKARTADKILDDAKGEFEAWRKPPPADLALCTDDEKKLWRQSESVLRMGQIREPWGVNGRTNTGMILASLPPGQWHTGWVRDAQYAIVALARMGHFAEAKAALDFFLGTNPVGALKSYVSNYDYRISVVRYYGTGEEQADWNQDGPNVETDGWGMVLWSARQYVEASGDTAWLTSPTKIGPNAYDALKQGVAGANEANLEPSGIMKADSSIWEVHDANKRHYAFTSMSAARGLCDMAVLAQKANDGASVGHYQQLYGKAQAGILGAFSDPNGAIGGNVEGITNNIYFDGSVAELFDWNILDDWTGKTAKATLDMFQNLRVQSGGFKRRNGTNDPYDVNEWILVDLRISNAMRRSGNTKDADAYVATIVQKAAANFYLLPELYNDVTDIGEYTGSIPMVGYGGGAYVLTMFDRAGKIEPNDCGDGKGKTLPALSCTGISTNPGTPPGAPGGPGGASSGGPGDNGAPDASTVPYSAACLCNLHALKSAPPFSLLVIPLALLFRRRRR
jgi:hypothetical protein